MEDNNCQQTKSIRMFFLLLVFMTNVVFICARVPYQYQISNYLNLVSAYDYEDTYSTVEFIPLEDYANTMVVTLSMSILAINDFDEVAGSIEIVGALNMKWIDETPRVHSISFSILDPTEDFFLVPPATIWTPNLVLTNAVGESGKVGGPQFMAVFNMTTSEVSWTPRVILTSSCTPDMTFYPFDRQSCEFIFTPWGFYANEILLQSLNDVWDQSEYSESGEWDLISTSIEAFTKSGQSYIRCKMELLRKPLYASFNILLPVLILCGLNSVVFLLPAESGERIGFSITLFLSFMVFLNTVMDFMPRSSSPVSYLCFYLVVMMCNSAGMTLVTVLMMRIYHKPEKSKVPKWVSRLVTFINCGCAKLSCCVLLCRCLRDKICNCNKHHNQNKDGDGSCCSRICRRRKTTHKISTKTPNAANYNADDQQNAKKCISAARLLKCCLNPKMKQTDDSVENIITCKAKQNLVKDGALDNDGSKQKNSKFDKIKQDSSKQYIVKQSYSETEKSSINTKDIDKGSTVNKITNKSENSTNHELNTTKRESCFSGIIKHTFKRRDSETKNETQLESSFPSVENTKIKFRPGELGQEIKENNDSKCSTSTVAINKLKVNPGQENNKGESGKERNPRNGSFVEVNTSHGCSNQNGWSDNKENLTDTDTQLEKLESDEPDGDRAPPAYKELFPQIDGKQSLEVDSLDFFNQFQDSASEESDGETMSVYSHKSILRMKSKQTDNRKPIYKDNLQVTEIQRDKSTVLIPTNEDSAPDVITNECIEEDSKEDILQEYQDSLSEESDGETISIFSNTSRIGSANKRKRIDNVGERCETSEKETDQNIQHAIQGKGKLIEKESSNEIKFEPGTESKKDATKVISLTNEIKQEKEISSNKENKKELESKYVDLKVNSKQNANQHNMDSVKKTVAAAINTKQTIRPGTHFHNSPKKPTLVNHIKKIEKETKVNDIKKKITFAKDEQENVNEIKPHDKLTKIDEPIKGKIDKGRRYSTPYIRPTDKPRRHSVAHTIRPALQEFMESEDEDDGLDPDVEWADVGRVLDLFFFLAFLALQIFLTIVFFIPIATSSSSEGE